MRRLHSGKDVISTSNLRETGKLTLLPERKPLVFLRLAGALQLLAGFSEGKAL